MSVSWRQREERPNLKSAQCSVGCMRYFIINFAARFFVSLDCLCRCSFWARHSIRLAFVFLFTNSGQLSTHLCRLVCSDSVLIDFVAEPPRLFNAVLQFSKVLWVLSVLLTRGKWNQYFLSFSKQFLNEIPKQFNSAAILLRHSVDLLELNIHGRWLLLFNFNLTSACISMEADEINQRIDKSWARVKRLHTCGQPKSDKNPNLWFLFVLIYVYRRLINTFNGVLVAWKFDSE